MAWSSSREQGVTVRGAKARRRRPHGKAAGTVFLKTSTMEGEPQKDWRNTTSPVPDGGFLGCCHGANSYLYHNADMVSNNFLRVREAARPLRARHLRADEVRQVSRPPSGIGTKGLEGAKTKPMEAERADRGADFLACAQPQSPVWPTAKRWSRRNPRILDAHATHNPPVKPVKLSEQPTPKIPFGAIVYRPARAIISQNA